ncbi:UNVERIFIED_CONTAM: hypothetical protein NY603_29205, partial [Bacteroidetes bacterium 56_B9]
MIYFVFYFLMIIFFDIFFAFLVGNWYGRVVMTVEFKPSLTELSRAECPAPEVLWDELICAGIIYFC